MSWLQRAPSPKSGPNVFFLIMFPHCIDQHLSFREKINVWESIMKIRERLNHLIYDYKMFGKIHLCRWKYFQLFFSFCTSWQRSKSCLQQAPSPKSGPNVFVLIIFSDYIHQHLPLQTKMSPSNVKTKIIQYLNYHLWTI